MERKRLSEAHFIMFIFGVTFRFLHTFVRPQLLFSHRPTTRDKGLKECRCFRELISKPQAVKHMINEVSHNFGYG